MSTMLLKDASLSYVTTITNTINYITYIPTYIHTYSVTYIHHKINKFKN